MDELSGGSIFSPIVVRRERWPGGPDAIATPLVSSGQDVRPDQPALRWRQEKPGNVRDFASNVRSEMVPAGLGGRVVALSERGGVIIESSVVHVPGRLGVGRQVAGILTLWHDGLHPDTQVISPGAILVVPSMLTFSLLRRASVSGVVGIVAGSITLRDLEGFLRTDLVKLQSSENSVSEQVQAQSPPITLMFTEGVGAHVMPEHFFALASHYQGSIALLNGYTFLRRGIFPELLISLPSDSTNNQTPPRNKALIPGALVRICSGKHTSKVGVLDYLFIYGYTFPSGVQARAARVHCDDDTTCIVPLVALERIG